MAGSRLPLHPDTVKDLAGPAGGKSAAEILVEVDDEVKRRRELRRPKWMRERPEPQRLKPAARKIRREQNQARRRVRAEVRDRHRHGRPRGR